MLREAREAMQAAGCWSANQQMGMRWPVGCVALEITQRCNLDCTLCYLSESSEAVADPPLEEIFARIERIRSHYGANVDVQVTGGEPTLRRRDELVAIVRRLSDRGLRPTLMTNGRRATRELLAALAEAGLLDVAFHVDTTQQLKGYANEAELNALRAAYLDRARGLPLSVMFNTTVHDGNFGAIPDVVRFFRANAGRVRTASFQVQAQTGRGVHEKQTTIGLDEVAAQIERGAGTSLNFHGSLIGHPRCNRYALCLAANGALHDALDDAGLVGRLQPATAHLVFDRRDRAGTARSFLAWLAAHPRHWPVVAKWTTGKLWRMKGDLVAARGRVQTLSFIVHGFMDAAALDEERIGACVFKVMTGDGPVSMCLHNARREAYLRWQPLRGSPGELKYAKGRTRRRLMLERRR